MTATEAPDVTSELSPVYRWPDLFQLPTVDERLPIAGYLVLGPRGQVLSGLWAFVDAPGQRWARVRAEQFAARHPSTRIALVPADVEL